MPCNHLPSGRLDGLVLRIFGLRISGIQGPKYVMKSLLAQASLVCGDVGTTGEEGLGPLSSPNSGFGLCCSAAFREMICPPVMVIFSSS